MKTLGHFARFAKVAAKELVFDARMTLWKKHNTTTIQTPFGEISYLQHPLFKPTQNP